MEEEKEFDGEFLDDVHFNFVEYDHQIESESKKNIVDTTEESDEFEHDESDL